MLIQILIAILAIGTAVNIVLSSQITKCINVISKLSLLYLKKVKCSNKEFCNDELVNIIDSLIIYDPYIINEKNELKSKIQKNG